MSATAITQLFKIGEVDWTPYLTVPDYSVNDIPVYDEWTDANKTKHRDLACSKLNGTFTVKCPSLTVLDTLLDSLDGAKDQYGCFYTISSIWCNNTRTAKTNVKCYIDMEDMSNEIPIMGLTDQSGFEITIEER